MNTHILEIFASKKNDNVQLSAPGNDLSRVGVQLAFEAIVEKFNEERKNKKFTTKSNGELKIIAELPHSEPWLTKVQIISDGFDLYEIKEVIERVNKHYADNFNG